MADFLLELRSEEIPARMQDKAHDDLARLFTAELGKAGIVASAIVTYATPRRLTLIARDLPLETAATAEETKGPKTSAPPQALEGFLRKTGLTREQLIDRDGVLFAVIDKPGRATADVLAEAIPAIIRAFPWPKSMRWGSASTTTESLKWVRPLQGIVALLGEEIVALEIAGVASSAATVGHRFHHPGPITIGSAADYVEKLRACHVIVDQDERRQIIALGATMAARKAGLELIQDDGLLTENAGLTEWPVPLLGRFDEAFLGVPPEVIQLTARVNQKYFVCRDADGKLANAFVCTANIDAADGGAKIVEGNRKVLAARLSDAKFFYDTDLKVPLDEQAKKLGQIVFHEKLGTVADKVDRVAKLARWLVEEGIVGSSSPSTATTRHPREGGDPASSSVSPGAQSGIPVFAGMTEEGRATLATQAERAARLAKADLVTGMVGEFPELQGLMGGYYALAQGEDAAVAEAIRDHYKPVGHGDAVPTAPVTVAVSLADKLDTIAAFFAIGEMPTGSKDPFALRRAAISMIALIKNNKLNIDVLTVAFRAILETRVFSSPDLPGRAKAEAVANIVSAFDADVALEALRVLLPSLKSNAPVRMDPELFKKAVSVAAAVRDFMLDRLEHAERAFGVRVDIIRAAQIIDGDRGKEADLVRLLARVHALQAFVGTPDGANLLAGYKRAANILKKEGVASPNTVIPAQAGISGDGAGQEPLETSAGLNMPHMFKDGPGDHPTPHSFAGVTDGGAAIVGSPHQIPLSYTPETAEAALITALDAAAPQAQSAVAREDFEGAMAALASLRAPIDAFFDSVTVNDPEPAKRSARLALLARVRDAVHTVADFSKIEG